MSVCYANDLERSVGLTREELRQYELEQAALDKVREAVLAVLFLKGKPKTSIRRGSHSEVTAAEFCEKINAVLEEECYLGYTVFSFDEYDECAEHLEELQEFINGIKDNMADPDFSLKEKFHDAEHYGVAYGKAMRYERKE